MHCICMHAKYSNYGKSPFYSKGGGEASFNSGRNQASEIWSPGSISGISLFKSNLILFSCLLIDFVCFLGWDRKPQNGIENISFCRLNNIFFFYFL